MLVVIGCQHGLAIFVILTVLEKKKKIQTMIYCDICLLLL